MPLRKRSGPCVNAYSNQNSGKKGLTLLELLVTLLLGTLLLLLLYQAFGEVAQDFLAVKQGRDLATFIKFSEGLRRQVTHLDASAVNIGGRRGSLFFWKTNTLAFLTSFGPGGKTLVVYHCTPQGLFYAEVPYTGQYFPPNILSAIKELPHPPTFFVPRLKISLLKEDNGELKELSHWQGLPTTKDHLVIKVTTGGYERILPLCP